MTAPIPFTKMEGLGNDYIYVNGFAVTVEDPAALARAVSDRHFGVGGDGLVLLLPSASADVRMRMWNADGSESAMCGNALRCIARYAYEHGLVRAERITIETGAGPVVAELLFADADAAADAGAGVAPGAPGASRRVRAVRTDLGAPILERSLIPMAGEPAAGRLIGEPFAVGGHTFTASAVSMGNPHLVLEVDSVKTAPVTTLGPVIERDPRFPARTNVGFAEVVSPDHVRLRVWERGSGETLACGSGAAAATVALTLRGRVRSPLAVDLPGGRLVTRWREGEGVVLEGPARFVCDGTFDPR